MSQSEVVSPSPAQIDARWAWVYPICFWVSLFIWAYLLEILRPRIPILREPEIRNLASLCVTAIQLWFMWRGVFLGIRALKRRSQGEPSVVIPATIGLTISFGTLALILVAILIARNLSL